MSEENNKTVLSIICGACALLKGISQDDDAWGNTFVAGVCGICAAAGTVAAVDSINKAYRAGKKTARVVNVAADVAERALAKGLKKNP